MSILSFLQGPKKVKPEPKVCPKHGPQSYTLKFLVESEKKGTYCFCCIAEKYLTEDIHKFEERSGVE